jgi:hypothetical protein
MDSVEYKKIKDSLRLILRDLESNDTKTADEVKNSITELEYYLTRYSFTSKQQDEVISLFTHNLHKYHQYFTDYTAALEKEFTLDTIKNGEINFELLQKSIWYYKFEDLVKLEVKLANIDVNSKVLFIGSGPFPMSPILYQKHAGCQVVGLEKEAAYADTSRKLIQALGLTDSITIKTGLGQEFINDSYTHVIAGLQALPKDVIFEQIHNQMPSGTTVICRVKSGFGSIFYDGTIEERLYDKYFTVEQRVHDRHMVIVPVLLKTK